MTVGIKDQKGVRRPNILIIYPDQMRADVMGCAGNRCIKTPYLNRLATEGVRFTNAFTSFPLCSPFRASLFTGKYAHAAGVYANHYPIPTGQDFLADILKKNGYQTGYIGKWHLDGGDKPGFVPPGPRRLGFDYMVGFNRGHFYLRSIFYRDTGRPYHCERFEPEFQTDHLLEFLESCTQDPEGRPFLGMICYGIPHFPMEMPAYYRNLYRPDEVTLPPRVADPEMQKAVRKKLAAGNFPLASGVWGKDAEVSSKLESEEDVRGYLALYYGLVSCVDHNVGIILNWLDQKGLTDDTVVILLSDHGDMAGEKGYSCRTKKTPYSPAMRVPLIVRYPRLFPHGVSAEPLVDVSVDTMPTLLETCGIPIPETVQGKSYLPLLKGSTRPTRDAVFYEILMEKEGDERFPIPERGVRTLDWLYCRTEEASSLLVDLIKDPLEMNNLVDSPEHQEVMTRLDRMIEEHMKLTGDSWSCEADFPPPGFLTHEEGEEKLKRILEEAIRIP